MGFNKLTAAQAERLALLAEELGEGVLAIGKILRHGYDSVHPYDPDGPSNRQALEREMGDVRHAVARLCAAGDLDAREIDAAMDDKAERVAEYLHHQDRRP